VIGGDGEAERHPEPRRLFQLLSTVNFTLLFANLKNAEAMHRSVQSSLAPWKALLRVHSIMPASTERQRFQSLFGSGASMIMVRPDGYAAFTGSDRSMDSLVSYLSSWKEDEAAFNCQAAQVSPSNSRTATLSRN
jgi:hypothetical protein